MARPLDLSSLDDLFDKGVDFELTDTQYEERIKKRLPNDEYYIKNRSPLAKKAREKGFVITSVIEKPIIMKTIMFKKVEKEK